MDSTYITDIVVNSSWYCRIVLVLICTVILNYLFGALMSKLHKRYFKTHLIKDIAVNSLRPPLHFFIVALGLAICAQITAFEFKWTHTIFIGSIKFVTVVVSLVWFLIRLIDKVEIFLSSNLNSSKSKLDKTSLGALAKAARLIILVLAILICMESLGFSVSGILAFGGVSGIIMGFASKDMLANFLGAIMIYLDKPFKVGDWIKLQEKSIEGYVEKIGLRCTVIRSLDKRPIYFPNSIFSLIPIENVSQMSHRQIKETIGIRHEDFSTLEQILQDISLMLKSHPHIDNKQTCCVNFTGFTSSSINITIMCFTKSTDYADFYNIQENILFSVARIIATHEAKVAQLPVILSKENL